MQNHDKFISLLYLAEGDQDWREEIVADLTATPEHLSQTAYYLVAQMPISEMYGKKITELCGEMGRYTIAPEWKATGQRSMAAGDVIYIGNQAYLSLAERDVIEELKDKFTLLPGICVTHGDAKFAMGVLKLSEATNKVLKGFVCKAQ